jgi:hypothetical protein
MKTKTAFIMAKKINGEIMNKIDLFFDLLAEDDFALYTILILFFLIVIFLIIGIRHGMLKD